MPKDRSKRPGQSLRPSEEKQPRGGLKALSIHTLPFKWTTESCDLEGPFGWSKIEHETLLKDIFPKLQNFESQTWGEIETQSNGRHHLVETSGMADEAKGRLEDTEFSGQENLFSLRVEGGCRLWGVRTGAVFQVLWYDPEHRVWPTEKDAGDKRKQSMKEQRNRQSTSK